MRIIGCDLHARQQSLAMLDTTTGEVVNLTLKHEGNEVREFYSQLPHPVLVGIEATGSMHWFLNLLEELGIECRVGHPAKEVTPVNLPSACSPRVSSLRFSTSASGAPVLSGGPSASTPRGIGLNRSSTACPTAA